MSRLTSHPILPPVEGKIVSFYFEAQEYRGIEGEPITSALIAQGIHVFGRHQKDHAPQGLFCANGQCSQCTVLVDGLPVKGCMTPLKEGMRIAPCIGYPRLPEEAPEQEASGKVETLSIPCLIIGGGPAGLAAAAELGRFGIEGILVDDRPALGGKLCLQTHKFFGSREACYAGRRGIHIAGLLEKEVEAASRITLWRNSPALGVFSDKKVGVLRNGKTYVLLEPEVLLVAAGAREKSLAFPGGDLPGIMGAGAFQTLVNRDRVLPGRRLFIVGGGNVGLIVAYHALQAGMEVVGLAEAAPACGGYRVHEYKIRRLGVPIFTRHTIIRAEGTDRVSRITVAALDDRGDILSGSEKRFSVDTVLLALGLNPVNELYHAAQGYGMKVYAAGDAEEISEAGAALGGGRIQSRRIARDLGTDAPEPAQWRRLLENLKSKGKAKIEELSIPKGLPVYPVIRCDQEIPCNPCTEVCPVKGIRIEKGDLLGVPTFQGDRCTGCMKCVLVCPGLAITLVDQRGGDGKTCRVTLPWELPVDDLSVGMKVPTVDMKGIVIGEGTVKAIKAGSDSCRLITLEVPFEQREAVASILPLSYLRGQEEAPAKEKAGPTQEIICRCERVTREEITALIREGCWDMNSLKAVLRVGMGACGGKTCEDLIKRLFLEEGIDPAEITGFRQRPPLQEVPLGCLAGASETEEIHDGTQEKGKRV